jgi:hypothetical protein
VELPVGGVIRKKNNTTSRQAETARLSQLADVLGMSQAEITAAQSDLAEQAYKAQVCLTQNQNVRSVLLSSATK